MTYSLELEVTMIDGSKDFDFCQVVGETREQAIKFQKDNLLSRIEKAKSGNKIWVSNSADYANWLDFLLV